jgi:hypothetical protein
MFTYFPKTKDRTDSGTGSLTAKIHNNYLYANYCGTPFVFVTNGELVALHTKHVEDLNTWTNISFNFFASIENKRYEFHEDIPSAPRPPSFSLTRFDPITADTYGIACSSKGNVGHIDIEESTSTKVCSELHSTSPLKTFTNAPCIRSSEASMSQVLNA